MPRSKEAVFQSAAPGVISVHELYTLDEAKRRLRWTVSSLRAARRKGLRLLTCGKRKYVSGEEIRRYLEQHQRPGG